MRPGSDRQVGKLVELSEDEIAEAKRLLLRLTRVGDELPMPGTALSLAQSDRLRERALEILDARRKRIDVFGAGMFTETAWDLLLLLYVAEPSRRETISTLALASGSSKTTLIRWFAYLEQRRLAQREPHPTDKRAAFLSLTQHGREMMSLYLFRTIRPLGD